MGVAREEDIIYGPAVGRRSYGNPGESATTSYNSS